MVILEQSKGAMEFIFCGDGSGGGGGGLGHTPYLLPPSLNIPQGTIS